MDEKGLSKLIERELAGASNLIYSVEYIMRESTKQTVSRETEEELDKAIPNLLSKCEIVFNGHISYPLLGSLITLQLSFLVLLQ